MEYNISKLSKISGVSTRMLRYYDEIGLLKPARVNSNSYRIYGQNEIDKLQQILFYKELGISLNDILDILSNPEFNKRKTLKSHLNSLKEKKYQLNLLINNVEKTLQSMEGTIIMSDKEKFEGFKKDLIKQNEDQYGSEIREKYGDDEIDKSNAKMMNMSEEEYTNFKNITKELNNTLREAALLGNPISDLAMKTCKLHEDFIKMTWSKYSKEAHLGLCEMYIYDERFTSYYDKICKGSAKFLLEAMKIYLNNN